MCEKNTSCSNKAEKDRNKAVGISTLLAHDIPIWGMHSIQKASNQHQTILERKSGAVLSSNTLQTGGAHRSIVLMGQRRGTMGGIQGKVMQGLGGAAGGGIGGQAGGCQAVRVDCSLGGANSDGAALQHLQVHHRQSGVARGTESRISCP